MFKTFLLFAIVGYQTWYINSCIYKKEELTVEFFWLMNILTYCIATENFVMKQIYKTLNPC